MSGAGVVGTRATASFRQVSGTEVKKPAKRKRPSPFPVRFSDAERAYLEQLAGNLSLGSYIRQELLKDFEQKETQPRRKLRKPSIDDQKIAALLAGLGQSRIPNNLNQLAKAANCGTLDTSEEVEKQLEEACAAVLAMREALFIALGLRCGGDL